jgi:drug/metabolite transporter (DMT)-like permease
VEDKQPLGKIFLESSAISAYGIWVIIFLFPLILAGIIFLIDERRSPKSLILSSIAIGIIAVSYILRFYLVRNTESLRSKFLQADNREQALKIIIGGFWWWLITLICAISAVISSRNLF